MTTTMTTAPATPRSDPRRRARWLAGIALAGTVLGIIATLDPTTVRPGWATAFLIAIVGSALIAAASWRWGATWSDRTIAGAVGALDVMVLASILANQDRSAALLNLILLLPPTLFVAVLLRPPFPRGQEVAVVVGCGTVTALMAADPVQWLSLMLLPSAALVGAAETVLAQRRHLETMVDSLEHMSMTDALTGVLNRRGITVALFTPPQPPARHLSVLMLDIDRFKEINDRYGHVAGDEVLRAVGTGLLGEIRSGDLAARLGGEEFAVVTRSSPTDAAAMAERLRHRAMDWMAPWSGTVSVGCASTGLTGPDGVTTELLSDLMERADRCLYRAKRDGRNRVVREDGWPPR